MELWSLRKVRAAYKPHVMSAMTGMVAQRKTPTIANGKVMHQSVISLVVCLV